MPKLSASCTTLRYRLPQRWWPKAALDCGGSFIYSAHTQSASRVSGSQRSQRPQKRRSGIYRDLAWLGRRRHAVRNDVEHLVVGYARRLELSRVACIFDPILEPGSAITASAPCTNNKRAQLANRHHPSNVCGFLLWPWSNMSWLVKKVPLSPKRCTSSTCAA